MRPRTRVLVRWGVPLTHQILWALVGGLAVIFQHVVPKK